MNTSYNFIFLSISKDVHGLYALKPSNLGSAKFNTNHLFDCWMFSEIEIEGSQLNPSLYAPANVSHIRPFFLRLILFNG